MIVRFQTRAMRSLSNIKNLGVKDILGIQLVQRRRVRIAIIRCGLRLCDCRRWIKNDRLPILYDDWGIDLERKRLGDNVRFFFNLDGLVVATAVLFNLDAAA